MNKYYFSRNYKELFSAGSKAKNDTEKILADLGFKNAGLARTTYKNPIIGFLITLYSMLKVSFTISKGDILVIQYPLRKYFVFVCKIAHILFLFILICAVYKIQTSESRCMYNNSVEVSEL